MGVAHTMEQYLFAYMGVYAEVALAFLSHLILVPKLGLNVRLIRSHHQPEEVGTLTNWEKVLHCRLKS